MEPENLSPQLQPPESSQRPLALYAMVSVGVIFIAIVGWIVWHSYQTSPASPLHVVSTNPSLNTVTNATPFVKLTFNKPLTSTGLAVTSKPSIISSNSVSGDTLTLNLKTPLDPTKKYTITVQSISDTSGGKITNEFFAFQPLATIPAALPKDQQQAITQQQSVAKAAAPYGLEQINFTNFDSLVNGNDSGTYGGGVTSDQESNLEYAFFEFGSTQTPNTTSVTLDQDTIVPLPPNPNSSSTVATLHFNVAVDSDSDNYSVRMDYQPPSIARLYLYKLGTTSLVYDSGNVNVYN